MTCTLPRPEPQTLFDRIKNKFQNTVLGGATVIPESNEWYVVSNDYAMAEQFYALADQINKETNPETACCDNLYEMAEREGVFPLPATFAEGYVTITGTAGSTLPSYIEVTTSNGNFGSVSTLPATLPATGNTTFRVRAITPGATGNSNSADTTGTLVTPITGIESSATVNGGTLCGGTDAETCEQFRTRYVARKRYKPRATYEWLQEKLLEWPCATRVCEEGDACCVITEEGLPACDPLTNFQFYVMFDNTFENGIAPQCVNEEVEEWMFGSPQGRGLGQAEIGVCGTIRTAIPAVINIVVDTEECVSADQSAAITASLQSLFATLCPSVDLLQRMVDCAVADVLGAKASYFVEMVSADDNSITNPCGDITPVCDGLPVLGTLTLQGPAFSEGNECA